MYKRSLEPYFVRILKRIYPSKYMLHTSKVYLSQLVSMFCSRIIRESVLYYTPNTILSVRVLEHVLSSYLRGGVLEHAVSFGNKCSVIPKEELKEILVIPISYIKHISIGIVPEHVKVSSKYYTFLCAVVDYLCHEIIDLSVFALSKRKKSRIRPEDILDALYSDSELWFTVRKLNIVFIHIYKECSLSDTCVLEILNRIDPHVKYSQGAISVFKKYIEHTILHDLRTCV